MSHQDDHNDCLRCFLLLCQHKPITHPLNCWLYDDKLVYLAKQEAKTDIRMNEWWTCSSLKWTWGRLKWMRFEMWSEDTNTVNCLCQLCFVVNLCNFLTDTVNAFNSYAWERKKRRKNKTWPSLAVTRYTSFIYAQLWCECYFCICCFLPLLVEDRAVPTDQKSDSRLKLWDAPSTGSAF